jgi:hypothetical protein
VSYLFIVCFDCRALDLAADAVAGPLCTPVLAGEVCCRISFLFIVCFDCRAFDLAADAVAGLFCTPVLAGVVCCRVSYLFIVCFDCRAFVLAADAVAGLVCTPVFAGLDCRSAVLTFPGLTFPGARCLLPVVFCCGCRTEVLSGIRLTRLFAILVCGGRDDARLVVRSALPLPPR